MSAQQLLLRLEAKKLKLAVAESLTGGLLAAEFVSVPGASKVFLGSIVAYQTELKHQLLGVSNSLLQDQGAVNAEVAAQMAGGIRAKFASKLGLDEAQVIAISTTGVAGPDPQDGQAAGTVFIGIASPFGESVYAHEFDGDRQAIRAATVAAALEHLGEQISH